MRNPTATQSTKLRASWPQSRTDPVEESRNATISIGEREPESVHAFLPQTKWTSSFNTHGTVVREGLRFPSLCFLSNSWSSWHYQTDILTNSLVRSLAFSSSSQCQPASSPTHPHPLVITIWLLTLCFSDRLRPTILPIFTSKNSKVWI